MDLKDLKDIKITISAPRLEDAINHLALALHDYKAVKIQANTIQMVSNNSEGDRQPSERLTLKTVNEKLAGIFQAGKQEEFRVILTKNFGVSKLTELPENRYTELLELAKQLM